jgi:hypothetical protein
MSHMYEDQDPWPIKCLKCLNEFTEKVGRLKAEEAVRCPECGLLHKYSREEFGLALAQAQQGIHNPWRNMLRISKST